MWASGDADLARLVAMGRNAFLGRPIVVLGSGFLRDTLQAADVAANVSRSGGAQRASLLCDRD